MVNQPPTPLPEFKSKVLKSLSRLQFGSLGFWLLGLTVAFALMFWNWKLVLATIVGMLVMWLVYRLQFCNWQSYWSNLRRLFGGANRQLTIAVGSGGLATLCTYMAVSIGVDTNSPWIAAGTMLQGFGTLAILVLLIWVFSDRFACSDRAKLDQVLADLTHTDPLKRLIAVRYLISSVRRFDVSHQRHFADCFRLMLSREEEAVIRDAVLDGLKALENNLQMDRATPSFSIPVDLKRSDAKSPCHL